MAMGGNPLNNYLRIANQWYRRGIAKDQRLYRLLSTIPFHKFIITNASRNHATMSLTHLGLLPMFTGMIDANHVNHLKPHPEPYQMAQQTEPRIYNYPSSKKSSLPHPLQRVFFDDLVENLSYPSRNGWTTILIGQPSSFKHPHVSHSYPDIYHALEDFIDHMKKGKKW